MHVLKKDRLQHLLENSWMNKPNKHTSILGLTPPSLFFEDQLLP